jgi:hypothetical protein
LMFSVLAEAPVTVLVVLNVVRIFRKWRSTRTSNATEGCMTRKCRIKTQTVLLSAETAA